MKPGIFHKIILSGILILSGGCLSAQILKKPDPNLVVDRSKGILVITPCISGSFSLNNYLLTEISANDTIYIFNVNPGDYSVKFTTDTGSIISDLSLEKGKFKAVKPCHDSISVQTLKFSKDPAVQNMTGNTIRVRRSYFYNITQFALFNLYFGDDPSFSFFQSFTTINGYQVTPGFCAGLGVAYNYYPFEKMTPWDVEISDVRLNFLPVFFDIRAHLHPKSRTVTPFFKFDIGYNILLKKSPLEPLYPDYDSYEMNKGGIYLSPGFGLRIFINDLVQINTSLEYSFEKSSFYFYSIYQEQPQTRYNKFNFIKLTLGVSFQYK